MKKLLVVTFLPIALLSSCGGTVDDKKSDEWTVCKCHEEMDKLDEELKTDGGSEELADKMRAIVGKCDKIQDEIGMEEFMAKKADCLK